MSQTNSDMKARQVSGLRSLLAFYDYDKQEMAKCLGVDKSVVYAWFGRGRISAKMAIKADKLTGGKITKQILRPDVLDWVIEG